MKEIMGNIKRLAQTDSTILMTGETGTGKSFLSGNIHYNSPRRVKPFIKVNCANIPETLLESELFGHEKGAFTGAEKTRTGRFEQADKGTLFLDEFCELSFDLQAKLLRVLQERTVIPVGGREPVEVDVRIVSATHRALRREVEEGRFRADLLYRLRVIPLFLPALRERPDDVEPIAWHILQNLDRPRRRIEKLAPSALDAMRDYAWPGNVRELENVIRRGVLLERGEVITGRFMEQGGIDIEGAHDDELTRLINQKFLTQELN